MNIGSPFLASSTLGSFSTSEPTIQPRPPVDEATDTKSELHIHFMRMMEAHDRVRAKLLESSHDKSYAVWGD